MTKKPVTTPAGDASHQLGLSRLGGIMHTVSGGSTPLETGTALDKAIQAGVKAITPGKQNANQVQELMVKFRHAFVRQLAATAAAGVTSDSGTL